MRKEFLELAKKSGIDCEEVALPGLSEPEVGFTVPHAKIGVLDSQRDQMSDALYENFLAWTYAQPLMPIPPDVVLPDECYPIS